MSWVPGASPCSRAGPSPVSSHVPASAGCLPGFFGAGCQHVCGCLHGGLCDRHTGHCLCPAGWTGDKCQSCEWGGLGPPPVWPHARVWRPPRGGQLPGRGQGCGLSSRGLPASVQGAAPSRTQPPARPPASFPAACPKGTFGVRCEGHCACRRGATCHHVTGACLCPPGLRGLRCENGEPPAPLVLRVGLGPSHGDPSGPTPPCSLPARLVWRGLCPALPVPTRRCLPPRHRGVSLSPRLHWAQL